MILIIAIVVVALSASSCNPTVTEPMNEPMGGIAPVLQTGEYVVRVVEVQDVQCRGASPAEFEGQVAWGFLNADRAMDGGPVTFDLEGVVLQGTMFPGSLSLAGDLMSAPPETDTTDRDDDVEYSDTGAPEGRGGGSGSSGSSGGSSSSDDAERPPQAYASLEANIQPNNHAIGIFAVTIPDCSYRVTVTLDLAGMEDRGDTGMVDYPTEPREDTGADTGDRPDHGDEGDTATGTPPDGGDDTARG